jgi:hypothetical protein
VTAPRRSWPALILLLAASLSFVSGCGEGPRFNPETHYTPESLAQELAFRFNALSPSGKSSTRTRRPGRKAVDSKADEQSTTKSQAKAATKKELPKTVDDVLDDIEAKVGLIQGMSRSDVVSKMVDALSKERSLPERDRQMLSGKLKEFGSG